MMKETYVKALQEMYIIDELIDIGFMENTPLQKTIEPDIEVGTPIEMYVVNLIYIYLLASKNNLITSSNELLEDYILLSHLKMKNQTGLDDLKRFAKIFKESLPKHWREYDDIMSAKKEGYNKFPDYYYFRIINNPLSVYDPVVPELPILELYDGEELNRHYHEHIGYLDIRVNMEKEEFLQDG